MNPTVQKLNSGLCLLSVYQRRQKSTSVCNYSAIYDLRLRVEGPEPGQTLFSDFASNTGHSRAVFPIENAYFKTSTDVDKRSPSSKHIDEPRQNKCLLKCLPGPFEAFRAFRMVSGNSHDKSRSGGRST